MTENSQYSSASYYWNVRQLVSSTLEYLSDAVNDGVTIGPSANVNVFKSMAVDLKEPGAGIVLGKHCFKFTHIGTHLSIAP